MGSDLLCGRFIYIIYSEGPVLAELCLNIFYFLFKQGWFNCLELYNSLEPEAKRVFLRNFFAPLHPLGHFVSKLVLLRIAFNLHQSKPEHFLELAIQLIIRHSELYIELLNALRRHEKRMRDFLLLFGKLDHSDHSTESIGLENNLNWGHCDLFQDGEERIQLRPSAARQVCRRRE